MSSIEYPRVVAAVAAFIVAYVVVRMAHARVRRLL